LQEVFVPRKDSMVTGCSFGLLIMVTPTLSFLGHPQMHPLPSVVRRRGETISSTGWVVDEKRGGVERARDSGEVSGDNGMDRGSTAAMARKGEMKKTHVETFDNTNADSF